MDVELEINGTRHKVTAGPRTTLLHALREQLGMTGTKYGCGEGQCGACTVLINGKARRACSTTAISARGRAITTIEGLETGGRLHPVQEAFLSEQALQCGYCTPGMILASVALLRSNPNPSDREIAHALEGNICRCCVYPRIISAVHRAAALMKKS